MGRSSQFLSRVSSTRKMPGHIKKTSGPDPDPSPWLEVKHELKMKNKAKPYDPKKSYWVPDKATGGYLEDSLESKDGNKVTVKVNGEMKVFKEDQIDQMKERADLHLLWSLLYRHQPLQEVPHLHPPHHGAVRGQEEERVLAPYLRHRRGRLPGHDEHWLQPVHPHHWRVRCRKDREHQEGHLVLRPHLLFRQEEGGRGLP